MMNTRTFLIDRKKYIVRWYLNAVKEPEIAQIIVSRTKEIVKPEASDYRYLMCIIKERLINKERR